MAYEKIQFVNQAAPGISAARLMQIQTQYDEAAADLAAHAAETSAHSATSAATASRIMMRDASGRAKVAPPAATDDVARLQEIQNAEIIALLGA